MPLVFITEFHCFPKCFLGAQTRTHLLRKQDVSEQIQTQILAASRETFASANDISATSSFEGAFGILKNYFIAVSF